MKTILAIVPTTILVAACTSTGMSLSSSTPGYWRGTSSSLIEFQRDNTVCSGRAARFGNVDASARPDNRMDRPMQRWPNATAQDTYEACMLDYGWRPLG